MRGLFLATVPLLTALILGCRGPGAPEKSDAARVSLPGETAPFPPYYCGSGYEAAAPGADGTCGLSLVPVKADQRPPKAIWIHRVKKVIPGKSRAEAVSLIQGIGFAPEELKEFPQKAPIRGTPGSLGMAVGWPQALILYESPAEFMADRISTIEEYNKHKPARLLGKEENFEIGKKELARMGLLPSNLEPKWRHDNYRKRIITDDHHRVLDNLFYCGGLIEGLPVRNDNYFLNFSIIYTGELGRVKLAWKETERYAYLALKTPEEAFEALNRGWAQPVPKELIGGKASLAGIQYWPEGPGTKFIHLVYFFTVEKDGRSQDLLVPAIKSEYFADPKHQVAFGPPPVDPEAARPDDGKGVPGIAK
jgi:hypothetical protein